MASSPPGLQEWDIVILVVFIAVVVAIGIYSMFRTNRGTVSGYFLAGRYMKWIPVGASVFASNIGSEHFIGLAGSGAAAGIGVGAFEVNAMIMIQILGWVFAPVYIASGACTLPEYIRRRFGGVRIRVWLSVFSLLLYIFTKISVNLFSGALFIRLALGWNLYLAILLMLLISCLCTITGGLAAVIYTDTLCTALMTVGSLIVAIMGFSEIGGYNALKDRYMVAVSNDTLYSNSTCGRPRPDSFFMLRDPINSDIPWPGFIIGETIISIWYWCADQVIVQRVVAAKSLSHAQGGCLLAGYLKILPLFTLLMPGMISRVLSPDRVACSVPEKCMEICGSEVGCTNIAYPELVLKLMPTGLRGLMMAVMMAALMSDLTSIFNSASTLFTIDVYGLFRKKASVRELMIVGRIMVAVMTGISILWIPVIQNVQGGQLFMYIQAVTAYLSPPIAGIYVVALFWKRATESGAFWGMMIGFAVGAIRMTLDFVFQEPRCGQPDNRPAITRHVHFMYFAIIAFLITIIATVIISYLTKPADRKLSRVTWWNRYDHLSTNDDLETDRDNEIAMEHLQFHISRDDSEAEKDDQSHDGSENLADESGDTSMNKSDTHEPRPSLFKRFYNWFCGYDTGSEEAKRAAMEQQQRLAIITSLKQNPKAKIILNVNFLFISVLCVVMMVYFSV